MLYVALPTPMHAHINTCLRLFGNFLRLVQDNRTIIVCVDYRSYWESKSWIVTATQSRTYKEVFCLDGASHSVWLILEFYADRFKRVTLTRHVA